jgi:hypothetical protein
VRLREVCVVEPRRTRPRSVDGRAERQRRREAMRRSRLAEQRLAGSGRSSWTWSRAGDARPGATTTAVAPKPPPPRTGYRRDLETWEQAERLEMSPLAAPPNQRAAVPTLAAKHLPGTYRMRPALIAGKVPPAARAVHWRCNLEPPLPGPLRARASKPLSRFTPTGHGAGQFVSV